MIYFASGSNRPGDVRGLDDAGQALGVAVPELSPRAMEELATVRVPVFVDSGAFSEVEFGAEGPRVVRPLGSEHWTRVFEVYRELAKLEAGAWLVAPDMVGNQAVTLERLEAYRDELVALHAAGARIIVPIQKGALSMADFAARVRDLLGFDFVAGVPMKKDATTLVELARFVGEARPGAVHLLGLGPESPKFDRAANLVLEAGAVLTCDSVRLRALVGRTNGPGGGPRQLTAALDVAADELVGERFAATEGMDPIDYTDEAIEPSAWLAGAARRAFFAELATVPYLGEEELAAARADLDAWLLTDAPNGMAWSLDPCVETALDRAWASFHDRHTGSERKRRAVRSVFRSDDHEDDTLLSDLGSASSRLRGSAPARVDGRDGRGARGEVEARRQGDLFEVLEPTDARGGARRGEARPRDPQGEVGLRGDGDPDGSLLRRMGRAQRRRAEHGSARAPRADRRVRRAHDEALVVNGEIRTWMRARVADFVIGGHPDPGALAEACIDYHRARRVPDRPPADVYLVIAGEVFDAWETSGNKPPELMPPPPPARPHLRIVK